MGNKDSSKTRVAPFFDQLYERDDTGVSWLHQLIALGSRQEIVATVPQSLRLVPNHGKRWGVGEVALPAPQTLLEHLVANVDAHLVADSRDSGSTLAKRVKLAAGDSDTLAEALDAIRGGQRGKKWFVLEGESKPDALLECEDVVVCVEGKRTEAKCTTTTQWMRQRAQLVRHMDAAMDRFPHKRVFGLLIVEGEGGANAVLSSEHWRQESADAYSPSLVAASLPHRSEAERDALRQSILGLTTWQAACRASSIAWSSLPDVV